MPIRLRDAVEIVNCIDDCIDDYIDDYIGEPAGAPGRPYGQLSTKGQMASTRVLGSVTASGVAESRAVTKTWVEAANMSWWLDVVGETLAQSGANTSPPRTTEPPPGWLTSSAPLVAPE